MTELSQRFTNPSVRDFALALLCLLLMGLFRARDSYDIRPVWRHDLELDAYANGKFPDQNERLPAAKIGDVDNDGRADVVLITNERHLLLGVAPRVNLTRKVIPHLVVQHQVKLPVDTQEPEKTSQPVVLELGFAQHHTTATAPSRKQVIVVVLNTWRVLCYDHSLRLMWSKQLLNIDPDVVNRYRVKSMAAVVVPGSESSAGDGLDGLVVVGGSYSRTAPTTPEYFSELNESTEPQNGPEDALCHFATFALFANNGTVKWYNVPRLKAPYLNKDAFRDYKLPGVEETHTQLNDVKFLCLLPHSWKDVYDTRFTLVHLDDTTLEADSDRGVQTSPLARLLGLESDYLGYYTRAHTKHEHVARPNAVVQYTHTGLSVLEFSTGHVLGRLALKERRAYGDIQYDNVMESAYLNLPDASTEGCTAVLHAESYGNIVQAVAPGKAVWDVAPGKDEHAGPPVQTNIAELDVCETSESFTVSRMFSTVKKLVEDRQKLMVPVIVPSVAKKTGLVGVVHHLSGETLRSRKRHYDVIYYTSSGVVASMGGKGELNFKVSVPAVWSGVYSQMSDDLRPLSPESRQVYDELFSPSMVAVSFYKRGTKDKLLSLGWDHIALMDLYDGYVLGSLNLPCQTYAALTVGDFNDDSTTDVILHCPIGYIGLSLTIKPHYIYTFMIGLAVVLVVLLLTWCCSPELPDTHDRMD